MAAADALTGHQEATEGVRLATAGRASLSAADRPSWPDRRIKDAFGGRKRLGYADP